MRRHQSVLYARGGLWLAAPTLLLGRQRSHRDTMIRGLHALRDGPSSRRAPPAGGTSSTVACVPGSSSRRALPCVRLDALLGLGVANGARRFDAKGDGFASECSAGRPCSHRTGEP
jgi:hypothetical protein